MFLESYETDLAYAPGRLRPFGGMLTLSLVAWASQELCVRDGAIVAPFRYFKVVGGRPIMMAPTEEVSQASGLAASVGSAA